ncbi:hypothetical protein [Paracoccus thiocyanatus]|uniref:hypothetical protein n=1 Tax=Paracoccus thiocyanatus TaxID=34006 RepID=UPI00165F3B5C|nr:hypothetical protein [Paracoccus thiocyanatus]
MFPVTITAGRLSVTAGVQFLSDRLESDAGSRGQARRAMLLAKDRENGAVRED